MQAPHKLSPIHMWNGTKRLQTLVAPVAQDTITIRSLDWDRDRFDIEFALQEGTTYNACVRWGRGAGRGGAGPWSGRCRAEKHAPTWVHGPMCRRPPLPYRPTLPALRSYLIFGADKTALVDASHEKVGVPRLAAPRTPEGRAGPPRACRPPPRLAPVPHVVLPAAAARPAACPPQFRGLWMDTLKEELAAAGRGIDYVLVSHTEPDHSGARWLGRRLGWDAASMWPACGACRAQQPSVLTSAAPLPACPLPCRFHPHPLLPPSMQSRAGG